MGAGIGGGFQYVNLEAYQLAFSYFYSVLTRNRLQFFSLCCRLRLKLVYTSMHTLKSQIEKDEIGWMSSMIGQTSSML